MVTTSTPVTSLFRPLTRRPAALTVTVRELLGKVQAGEVRVPRFQRPLRWNRADVVELFDSIWRGYPIGSLLFWKRPAPAGRVRLGGAVIDAPAVTDAWWLVDGQQRTTALAASLLELDHAGDDRWCPFFDATEKVFLPGPLPAGPDAALIPVSVLGDLRRLGRWLREQNPSEAETASAEEAQQRLLDYSIPAYLVETDDELALRGVFARLNSSGSRMRADEVFQALLGVPTAGATSSLDLDLLQSRCQSEGFGTPPRGEVLKAVLAISGQDPSRRLEQLPSAQDLALAGGEAVEEALARTVEFLQDECRIPHYSLIPYPVVFVILARWFHVYPRSEPTIGRLLARWVWRGAASGAHQRAEVSRMREQVRAIAPDSSATQSLDRLLGNVEPQPSQGWRLTKFNLKSARSRIEVLALLEHQPRTPLGLVGLPELVTQGRVAREIFRSSDWKALPGDVVAQGRSAANRILLATGHTGLSAELRSWDWASHREALESHLIDEQAFHYLQNQEVGAFLSRRAGRVTAAVNSFLQRRAAWDEPQVRPLQAYLEMKE